eukprot:98137_1
MAEAHIKTQHLETLPPVVIKGRTSNNTNQNITTNRNCTKPQTLQIKTLQTETSTVRKADLIKIGIIARAACACVILIGCPAFSSLILVPHYASGRDESA